jgi:phage shock protein A
MKEGIAARVSRLISANAHNMVDKIEDLTPEAVMAQAMREIDGAVDEVRAELGRVVANKHLAGNRVAEERRRHAELGARIEVAVKEGRDDLAEAAIARQMDIEAQIPVLESAVADYGNREKELEGFVAALRAKKRDMEEELQNFRTASRAAAGHGVLPDGTRPSSVGDKVDKAAAAFNRVMGASGIPGGSKVDAKSAAQLAELEDLARKNRVRERLVVIKAGGHK